MEWDDGGGWSWFWMLPMVVVTLVLAGCLLWTVVAFSRSGTSTDRVVAPSAEDIVNERFARSELDAADYRERIDALEGSRHTEKK